MEVLLSSALTGRRPPGRGRRGLSVGLAWPSSEDELGGSVLLVEELREIALLLDVPCSAGCFGSEQASLTRLAAAGPAGAAAGVAATVAAAAVVAVATDDLSHGIRCFCEGFTVPTTRSLAGAAVAAAAAVDDCVLVGCRIALLLPSAAAGLALPSRLLRSSSALRLRQGMCGCITDVCLSPKIQRCPR